MKKPVCPFNYMEANLGLSRGDADCLLFKNTRDGMGGTSRYFTR